jgi:hypothetical protein
MYNKAKVLLPSITSSISLKTDLVRTSAALPLIAQSSQLQLFQGTIADNLFTDSYL